MSTPAIYDHIVVRHALLVDDVKRIESDVVRTQIKRQHGGTWWKTSEVDDVQFHGEDATRPQMTRSVAKGLNPLGLFKQVGDAVVDDIDQ